MSVAHRTKQSTVNAAKGRAIVPNTAFGKLSNEVRPMVSMPNKTTVLAVAARSHPRPIGVLVLKKTEYLRL
jgi:hypothetical protein